MSSMYIVKPSSLVAAVCSGFHVEVEAALDARVDGVLELRRDSWKALSCVVERMYQHQLSMLCKLMH